MSNPYDPSGGPGGGQQEPPRDHGAGPYGQPGQTPYGHGQQQPSPQPPYGQQPNPYDQQQNPYGQQQTPYGQNPYDQQNPHGSSHYASNPYAATPAVKTNGLAIASLITSLGGLLGFFCGFLGLAAPVGLVLGIIARSQIKSNPMTQSGEGLALGGIFAGAIISLVMLVFFFLYIAFYGWALFSTGNY